MILGVGNRRRAVAASSIYMRGWVTIWMIIVAQKEVANDSECDDDFGVEDE